MGGTMGGVMGGTMVAVMGGTMAGVMGGVMVVTTLDGVARVRGSDPTLALTRTLTWSTW